MKVSIQRLSTALALVLALALPAGAQEITVRGGGWGHGIGMSQYGAKSLAEQGKSAEQILAHFYTGTSIGQVGSGNLVGHAEPLRIGVAQSQSSLGFGAVGGSLTLCIDGACELTAAPEDGTVWSFRSNGLGACQFYKGGVAMGSPGACEGTVSWSGAPSTRVSFPSLNRTYARGRILFRDAPGDSFHAVVEIGLEEYLYGLGEMPSSWPAEALKAQAIAGRSYALWRAWVYRNLEFNQSRLDACACHLYSSTFDQKYIGWAKEAEGTNGFWGAKWRNAVDATAGKAMTHAHSGGRAIEAYYFSSSGGSTENNEDVWTGSPYPYLRSVNDPGFTTWSKVMTASQMASSLGFERIFHALITGTNASGSPKAVTVSGVKAGSIVTESFTGNQLRSKLALQSHYITGFEGFLPSKFAHFVDGDFDGDGKGEVAAFSSVDGSWWVFELQNQQLIGTEWADFVTASGWVAHNVGDFDGDGKDDIAQFHPSNGTWWVSRSTGSAFSTSLWADFSTPSGWIAQRSGDFDGDGKDDIAQFHPSNGTWWVSRSTGSGFATNLWADFSTASGWVAQRSGDFDGDGKDDIAQFHPSNGTWWVSRSTGSSFGTSLWADFTTASGWVAQSVGDFDGDGRDDVAQFHPSNGTWWVSKSSGSSFGTSLWADFTTATGWAPQIVGDFDGDGRDDIANFHSSNGTWWTSRSTGSSFATSLKGQLSPGTGWTGQLAVDVDGDGDDDVVNWKQSTLTWVIR